MQATRRSTKGPGFFRCATSTVLACLIGVVPLSADEIITGAGRQPTEVALPDTAMRYVRGDARRLAPVSRNLVLVGDRTTGGEPGSGATSRLWRLLNAGADRGLRLTMPGTVLAVVQPRPASRRGGTLRVTTEPSGARVYVDGVVRGRTPLEITDLAPGTHQLRVARDGYAEVGREVTLGAQDETLRVTLRRTAPRSERRSSGSGGGKLGIWITYGAIAAFAIYCGAVHENQCGMAE